MSFRSSRYCERYEYHSVQLQNNKTKPANNQFQKKSGHRFYIDNTSESDPFDWYNSYLEIDIKITQMDNTGYDNATANQQVATVNGGFSMINQLKVDFNGTTVVDSPQINHAINVKNLTEFSKSYSDRVGSSMFHYPDTSKGTAVLANYVAIGNGGGTQANAVPGENADYNEGFAKRKTLLTAGAVNNIILPLDRFSFFDSFRTEIAPNGKISLDVILENDANVLFGVAAGVAGRYVITKMVLWVPKMIFNPEGAKKFLSDYLKPHSSSYLKERIETSPTLQSRQGTFKLTSSITRPRHVFIWVLNNAKLNDQRQNMFTFNTYKIAGNDRTIVDCQLELSNGIFYPQERLRPTSELTKTQKTETCLSVSVNVIYWFDCHRYCCWKCYSKSYCYRLSDRIGCSDSGLYDKK